MDFLLIRNNLLNTWLGKGQPLPLQIYLRNRNAQLFNIRSWFCNRWNTCCVVVCQKLLLPYISFEIEKYIFRHYMLFVTSEHELTLRNHISFVIGNIGNKCYLTESSTMSYHYVARNSDRIFKLRCLFIGHITKRGFIKQQPRNVEAI